jgi:hypothetical protein
MSHHDVDLFSLQMAKALDRIANSAERIAARLERDAERAADVACPYCSGDGKIPTPPTWEVFTCPACRGSGVRPRKENA